MKEVKWVSLQEALLNVKIWIRTGASEKIVMNYINRLYENAIISSRGYQMLIDQAAVAFEMR